MSQRLSRKEIKRDEFLETLGGAFDYLRGHSHAILILVGAVLVGALLLGVFLGYRDRREKHADKALAKALQVYQAEIDPAAASPDDPQSPSFPDQSARARQARELFRTVQDDFRGSDAAGIATAYLGQIAVEERDTASARALWLEFLSEHSGHMLAAEVRVNLMSLDRTEGKGEELVTELRAMLSTGSQELPQDLILYQLALTLDDLGRVQEANETYQRIVEDFPQSVYASEARARTGGSGAQLFGS